MRNQTQAPDTYISKGVRVSKSSQHKEMVLLTDLTTNKWWAIHTSDEVLLRLHPIDKPNVKKRTKLI